MQLVFNFPLNQVLFYALATGDARPVAKVLRDMPPLPDAAQFATFLRSQDELDLGRLSQTQRAKVFEEFAPEPGMRLYERGIRRRLASMLGGERGRIELAYSLMLSLPGTPVLWYGEELGMGEELAQADRDAVRTPMQWSSDKNAGFSRGDDLVRPVLTDGPFSARTVNVAAQRRQPESLLREGARESEEGSRPPPPAVPSSNPPEPRAGEHSPAARLHGR
jgi:maltose alpha-D-glucosyltransferase / alpha-amylase